MIDDIITRERGIEAEAQARYDAQLHIVMAWADFKLWCRQENKKACFGSTLKEYVRIKGVKA